MSRRILFTGGGGAAAESIYEQWQARYDLYFGDADPEAISPRIPSERRVKLPFAAERHFAENLCHLARELALDLIVPGVDEELTPLAAHAVRTPVPIMVADPNFVETMIDKYQAMGAMAAAGLEVPRTVLFDSARELEFPMILKPRRGRGSRGVRQVSRREQLAAYLNLSDDAAPSAIVAQELAIGQEYTVFVAADREGRLAAIILVKVGLKRGITIRAETDDVPEIFDYVVRFHRAFRPRGVYNIQLILTSAGKVMPFEVNPRVSTTFCLAIATGFDPVATFLNGHSGAIFSPAEHWSLRRSWHNNIEILHRSGQSQG